MIEGNGPAKSAAARTKGKPERPPANLGAQTRPPGAG